MNCTNLDDFLHGDGEAPLLPDELRQHVDACPDCRQNFEAHQLLRPAVAAWRNQTAPPPELADRVLDRWQQAQPAARRIPRTAALAVAVAATLLIAITLTVRPFSPDGASIPVANNANSDIPERPEAAEPATLPNAGSGLEPAPADVVLRHSVRDASRLLADEVLSPWSKVSLSLRPASSRNQPEPAESDVAESIWWITAGIESEPLEPPAPSADGTLLNTNPLAEPLSDAVNLLETLLPAGSVRKS